MIVVVQRVSSAQVRVDGKTVGKIDQGLMLLIGVAENDSEKEVEYSASKCANLRIFPDENGLMNLSLTDTGGSALVVSQFTLWGDCRKGRRPSFINAADPEKANMLYEHFISLVKKNTVNVASGNFQEMMDVYLVNDGPVTILIDSQKQF